MKNNISVYEVNDMDFIAIDGTAEDVAEFYFQEYGEKPELENIEEIDIENEGMWTNDLVTLEDEETLSDYDEITLDTKFGSLRHCPEDSQIIEKLCPYKDVIDSFLNCGEKFPITIACRYY
jgi:hypothetical protein